MLALKGYSIADYQYEGAIASQIAINGGRSQVFRFLMECRPPRLMDLWISERRPMSLYNLGGPSIEAVEPIGLSDCVTLTTDTGTYIAEGFGAHNTYKTGIVWDK